MRFGKCLGTLGVIGVIYMRLGKYMVTLGGVIRGHLFEVWEVFGALGVHRVSFV